MSLSMSALKMKYPCGSEAYLIRSSGGPLSALFSPFKPISLIPENYRSRLPQLRQFGVESGQSALEQKIPQANVNRDAYSEDFIPLTLARPPAYSAVGNQA